MEIGDIFLSNERKNHVNSMRNTDRIGHQVPRSQGSDASAGAGIPWLHLIRSSGWLSHEDAGSGGQNFSFFQE